jgi:hypothetical protein
MRKFNPQPNNQLRAAVCRVSEVLYVGWALTALGFCGVIAVALL